MRDAIKKLIEVMPADQEVRFAEAHGMWRKLDAYAGAAEVADGDNSVSEALAGAAWVFREIVLRTEPDFPTFICPHCDRESSGRRYSGAYCTKDCATETKRRELT